MSQMTNFTVYDGAATPVAHVMASIYVRQIGDRMEALWRESLTGVPIYACPRCTLTMQKLKTGMMRVAFRFEIPVMESVSGQNASGYTAAPKVAYVTVAELVMYSHDRATIENRRMARMLPVNLGNDIATSVAAGTTGQSALAYDQIIMPT
jgi:hypothetical protein